MKLNDFKKQGFSLGSQIPNRYNNSDNLKNYHPKTNNDNNKYNMESKLGVNNEFLYFHINPKSPGWDTNESEVLRQFEFVLDPNNSKGLISRAPIDLIINKSRLIYATMKFSSRAGNTINVLEEELHWYNYSNVEYFTTKWFWQPKIDKQLYKS